MNSDRVLIYDTTLRDGTQGEGISFSVTDKLLITEKLDQFGIDYIEGGWPGSNPRDMAYFREARKLKLEHARVAAFGSTRRSGITAEKDGQLKLLLEAETPVVTIFGKSWLLHVTEVLRTTPEENLAMIEDSVRLLKNHDREVVYDAEHFFDGHADDADYAIATLEAAVRGGADFLVLCDTNGGRLVGEITAATATVCARFPDTKLGVHCHNDSGLGVAVSLAGVEAGAVMIQGTMNGFGERIGNANLTSILPNLYLKMGRTGASQPHLAGLRELSLFVDELANLRPDPKAPFVGQSAFTHKGGAHADATKKVRHSYEHIDPGAVGNRQRVLVSDMAGRSSLFLKARELGIELERDSSQTKEIIAQLKQLEFEGYEFEAADGSLHLLLARLLNKYNPHFEFEGYRVIVEKRGPDAPPMAEATVKIRINGEASYTVAESSGPVGALDHALRLGLEKVYPQITDLKLMDYKVRILDSRRGADAPTRVLIESGDGARLWGTVGVSPNLIEASWQAILDSVEYKLLRGEERAARPPRKPG
ncbi:MAG: citramalate synthase [Puniceicoccaceae bacterium]|nr:MAG: citramalate synthase [Puniceicoccaceae bacterium]